MSVVAPPLPVEPALAAYDVTNTQSETHSSVSKQAEAMVSNESTPPPPYTNSKRPPAPQRSATDGVTTHPSTSAPRLQRSTTNYTDDVPSLMREFAKAYDAVWSLSAKLNARTEAYKQDHVERQEVPAWTKAQIATMGGALMTKDTVDMSSGRKPNEVPRRPALIRENTCTPSYNKPPEQCYQEQEQERLYKSRQQALENYNQAIYQEELERSQRAQTPRHQRTYIQPPAPTPLQPQRTRASSAPNAVPSSTVTCMSYMNASPPRPAANPSQAYRPPPNPLYNIYRCNGVQVNYYDTSTRGPYDPLPQSARPIRGILKRREVQYDAQAVSADTTYEEEGQITYEPVYADQEPPMQQCGRGCGCVMTQEELKRIIQVERQKERALIEESLRMMRREKERRRRIEMEKEEERRRARRQRELEEKNRAWVIESGWNVS